MIGRIDLSGRGATESQWMLIAFADMIVTIIRGVVNFVSKIEIDP